MSEIKFKPLGTNVLIIAPPIELKSKAGIIKSPKQLEQEAAEWAKQNDYFTVAAVGEGVTTVKAGDEVVISGNGTPITIEGVSYFIIYSHSILGVKLK